MMMWPSLVRNVCSVGVRVAPWTVIIDRSGNVVAGGYGKIDLQSPEFRNYVKALAAKPPG